jgi:predicted  nucleic acid-binding Zn-ribbon protein
MEQSNKLAPSEIERLKGFMQSYARFYEQVEDLQNRLEAVENSKSDLLQEIQKVSADLEIIRLEENEYQKTLVAKYGEFHLDLETFEYKPA